MHIQNTVQSILMMILLTGNLQLQFKEQLSMHMYWRPRSRIIVSEHLHALYCLPPSMYPEYSTAAYSNHTTQDMSILMFLYNTFGYFKEIPDLLWCKLENLDQRNVIQFQSFSSNTKPLLILNDLKLKKGGDK